jgi:RimJ/RimL family protein N-acetyltransferase
MLKSERTLLRVVQRSDIPLLLKWFNDLDVIQCLSQYLPINEIAEEKWLEELSLVRRETDVVFIVEIIEGNKPIGSCGIHKINYRNGNAEITMVIGEKEYWGKGYGTEATFPMIEYCFNHLNLVRITAGAYSFNDRSVSALVKMGFQKEGVQRKAVFHNGKYYDHILFGLLREDWK